VREFLKNFFAPEQAKLKDMTFKEKAGYIWEYYKIPIIATIAVVLIVYSLINTIWIHPPKKSYLTMAFYSSYVDDATLSSLSGQLGDALMTPEELLTYEVTGIDFNINSGDSQMDMANTEKFMAMIAAHEIDLIIFSKTDLEAMAAQETLAPIKDYLPDSLPSGISDKLAAAPDVNGVQTDFAIQLDGSKFFESNGFSTDGLYMAVIVNTSNQDNVKNAIAYIFGS